MLTPFRDFRLFRHWVLSRGTERNACLAVKSEESGSEVIQSPRWELNPQTVEFTVCRRYSDFLSRLFYKEGTNSILLNIIKKSDKLKKDFS